MPVQNWLACWRLFIICLAGKILHRGRSILLLLFLFVYNLLMVSWRRVQASERSTPLTQYTKFNAFLVLLLCVDFRWMHSLFIYLLGLITFFVWTWCLNKTELFILLRDYIVVFSLNLTTHTFRFLPLNWGSIEVRYGLSIFTHYLIIVPMVILDENDDEVSRDEANDPASHIDNWNRAETHITYLG